MTDEPIKPGKGVFVEIGSGGGCLKEVIPHAITSDIITCQGIDVCCCAQNMPFKDGSVSRFLMLNVFHHINRPEVMLMEMLRVLKGGGRVIMIEPANTFWGRFIYSNFHHEPFDPGSGWELPLGGRLSCANQAKAWIVFCRDRELFLKKFPGFKIRGIKFHTPIGYLASGGLSFRPLLPVCSYKAVRAFERLISRVNRFIGMFMTIVLEKV